MEPQETLRWKIRLLADRPFVPLLIVMTALIGGLIGVTLFRSASMGLLGFAMILAATADYWLGTSYSVDARGIKSRVGLSLSSMEWNEVKRVVIEPSAIKLSPLARNEKMDAFRGVVLRTESKVRTELLEFIRLHVSPGTEFVEMDQELPR